MTRSTVLILTLALLVIGCGDGAESLPMENTFTAAAAANGREFARLRDELLERDRDELTSMLRDLEGASDLPWAERETAFILRGWVQRETACREFLGAERELDASGASRYAWVYDPPEPFQVYVPVLHELLIKGTGEKEGRQDAVDALLAIAARGSEQTRTIRPGLLLQGVQEREQVRGRVRRQLALVVADIDLHEDLEGSVSQALKDEIGDGEENSPKGDKWVARHLLDAVVRYVPPEESAQNEFMKEFGLDEALRELVDEDYALQRVARVGGEEAATEVGKYFDRVRRRAGVDASVYRWGMEAARSLPFDAALSRFVWDVARAEELVLRPGQRLRLDALNALEAIVRGRISAGATAELASLAKDVVQDFESRFPDGPLRTRLGAIQTLLGPYGD